MATTVFYAWQSDRDEAVCRYLIRDALKQAIKRLKADAKVQSAPPVELDHDTKGITGHPHIASAIRKKIKACGVFVADLTHVGEYVTAKGRRKTAQNVNVGIELGVAIRAPRGFERLLLVMNDHFGGPDDLPFDLKSHSYPITYTLADASDPVAVKGVREKLADAFAAKLKPILSEVVAESAVRLSGAAAKMRVNVTFTVETYDHSRVLNFDLLNDGIDLHQVSLRLEYPDKATGNMVKRLIPPVGRTPDPLMHGQSCRFGIAYNQPHEDWDQLADIDAVTLIVRSGVHEVRRLPLREWLDKAVEFGKKDMSLPAPPPPQRAREPRNVTDMMREMKDKYFGR